MTAAALRESAAHIDVDAALLDVDSPLVLEDDEQRYLTKVLRLRTGEVVTITDRGGRWRATTAIVEQGAVALEPVGDVFDEPVGVEFAVATAMPKGDRLDWMVQKLTELGAARITLLHTERSVVKWADKKHASGRARLERIITAACRQARRVWWPELVGPVSAARVLPSALVAEPGGADPVEAFRAGPVQTEAAGTNLDAASMLTVAIGPEGGWTDQERALGGRAVTLGTNVLRTETAAVCAGALLAVLAPVPSARSESLE